MSNQSHRAYQASTNEPIISPSQPPRLARFTPGLAEEILHAEVLDEGSGLALARLLEPPLSRNLPTIGVCFVKYIVYIYIYALTQCILCFSNRPMQGCPLSNRGTVCNVGGGMTFGSVHAATSVALTKQFVSHPGILE